MEPNKVRIKTGPAGGTGSIILLVLLLWIGTTGTILLALAIENLFPGVEMDTVLPIVMAVAELAFFGILIAAGIQRVWIEPEGTCVTFGKKPLWGMEASQIRFLAIVNTDSASAICLSGHTIEELAQMREQQLRRNWLSKDEVPLRKRKVGWRETFAKECLLHELRWGLFSAFRPNGLVILPGNMILLACIRALYPHLPYYNMTNIDRQYLGSNVPNRVPSPCGLDYDARIQPNGIYLDRFKKEVGFIPGSQIKTIVHLDYLCNRTNVYLAHTPAFMVCTQTVEELAAAVPPVLFGADTAQFAMEQETLAVICCLETFRRWKGKDLGMCPLQDSPTIRQQLKEYYPHAKFVDLSDHWMKNSNISGG